jgi:plasmid stabilization system protein ParE
MTRAYKVTVSPEALVEIVRVATWWREHRPASPRLFQRELDQALALISEYPEMGTVARSKRVANARVLQLTRSRYLVFYQVVPPTREVLGLHVRHGNRRPVKLRR